MKKIFFIIVFLFSTIALAKLGFNPKQLAKFQKTGSCEACDFTNAQITVDANTQPPFDLWGANLSEAIYAIKNNTLSDFSYSTAINTNFSNQDFSQAAFVNAILINTNFIHANLTYTNFAGANVTGANFSHANLYGSQGINLSQVYSVCDAILPNGARGRC